MAVTDTFTRTVASGWGTSDSGAVWTVAAEYGGSAADFSTDGSVGKHAHGVVNTYRRSVVTNAAILNPDQTTVVTTPVMLSGAALVVGHLARYIDANNYYWLRFEFNATPPGFLGTLQLKITKRVNGVDTQIASLDPVPDVTYEAGVQMAIRSRIIDDLLQVKVRRLADLDDGVWDLGAHDNDLSAAGGIGVQTWLVGGNTNTLPVTPTFDDYTADEAFEQVNISVLPQDSYPPRNLVSVTGVPLGGNVEVYRVVAGERTLLRGGIGESVGGRAFLRTDAELPFGVPVSYVAVVNGAEYSTTAVATQLPGGKVAVTDAVSGNSAEVVITAWSEKSYQRPSSVFKVGGRNVVVSGDLGMFEGDIELLTEADSSRQNLMALLRDATEGTVQIRQPGGYDGVDSYLSVLGVVERRYSQDGSDQRRVFALQVAEVEGWASALEAAGATLEDVYAVYEAEGGILNSNPYFETDVANWGGLNGSVVRSTAQAHEGVASLLLTPSGSATLTESRTTEVMTAEAGDIYQADAWVRCAASREVQLHLNWFTAAGAYLSTSSSTPVLVSANTWTPLTFSATAPVNAGRVQLIAASMRGTAGTVVEGFEGAPAVTITGTWVRGGGIDGFPRHSGNWSLGSAVIGHNQSSDAVVTVPATATTMTVWYKVSTESGFDHFRILRDGVQEFQTSGERDWTERIVDVTGVSQVTFRYIKDGSAVGGSDRCWIDDLSFAITEPVPASDTLHVDEATVQKIPALQSIANDYDSLLGIAQGKFLS